MYDDLLPYEICNVAFVIEKGYLMGLEDGLTMSLLAAKPQLGRSLFVGLCTLMFAIPAVAQQGFVSSVEKGVLLVASPSIGDPHFEHTVILIIEHGTSGTVGLVLNRPTDVLVSEVLPDVLVLKNTDYRLFAGGPVEQTRMALLFRLHEAYPDVRQIVDGLYMGTPRVLERMMVRPKPTEAFRAFAGFAGWGPKQLEREILEGAWGVLQKNSIEIFEKDPTTLWPDCIRRLQAPRTIAH